MQSSHLLPYLSVLACHVILLPFVACLSSHDEDVKRHNKSTTVKSNLHKLSPKLKSDITVHGILLWFSMGFLMPLGILIIRMSQMSHREDQGGMMRRKLLFYLHVIFQVLSVFLATAGAIMSIKSFENSFDNNHQRIGLALYIAIWIQAVIGFLRPHRGKIRRSTWYFVHWILGTIITLAGIINIYTGINAYHKKISESRSSLWTILFTAQVSFMAFFYLFQDKWGYLQKQGVILGDDVIGGDHDSVIPTSNNQVIAAQIDNHQKVLVPQPCGKKRIALGNLFE